jgi:hypothetical protein
MFHGLFCKNTKNDDMSKRLPCKFRQLKPALKELQARQPSAFDRKME